MRRTWRRRALNPAVLLAGMILAACATETASANTGAEQPPNIILVLVDDLGWTDLGCQGSEYYETPHIDRLASQGMRFTDAYAACAVCSPTRAAIMTGRYPARVGVTDWIRATFQRGAARTPAENPTEYVGGPGERLLCPPNPYWMEHEEVTLAEALYAAGYTSCHIGKWHLGDRAWYPEHQGFNENHGGCDFGQPPSYFDPYANKKIPDGIPSLPPREEGEYLTDREADEAVDFIRRHRKDPFFLYLAHYAVHTPIQGRDDLTRRYEEKAKTNHRNATYAAMIHSVDHAMGRVLKTLDETGLAERTLILFTSDNGGLIGPTDNAPLRSGKGYPYEGGIRVPFIARWPGQVPAGSTSSEPISSIDCFPTILEAAAVAPPAERPIDGLSLLDHLRSGAREKLGRKAIFWHFPHYRYGRVTPYSIVRSGDWKMIRYQEGPRFELFNLTDDLGEQNDLAAAEPERVLKLDRLLSAFLADTGARLPRPNPEYVPRVLILGDSISIGYSAMVQQALEGEALVLRPMKNEKRFANCMGTNNAMKSLDQWLKIKGGRWDVIHFNFGLHDLKRVHPDTGRNSDDPSHPRQASPEQYEAQLRDIVKRLKGTGAELIFATSTPIPVGGKNPYREAGDEELYNSIATQVMKDNGVTINDLHATALPDLDQHQQKDRLHFNRDGSRVLAEQVVRAIREKLETRN